MQQQSPTLPPGRDAFTVDEFATRWNVSPRTVERAIARGEIKVRRIGRLVRIPAKEVRRLLGGAS